MTTERINQLTELGKLTREWVVVTAEYNAAVAVLFAPTEEARRALVATYSAAAAVKSEAVARLAAASEQAEEVTE